MQGRINREQLTVKAMIQIYCKKQHHATEMCDDCSELLAYAFKRLSKCPYQEKKPTCAKCPIHCYKKEMREKIQTVMRFSGPRMPLRHPVLSVYHLMDGRCKTEISILKNKRH